MKAWAGTGRIPGFQRIDGATGSTMAVSFVTRFRRQIATIPFVIVVVVPVLLVILFLANRQQGQEDDSPLPAETVCLASERMEPAIPCATSQSGATD